MDPTKEHSRSPQIPGFHWLLLILHTRILTDCSPTPRPHQTSHSVALERQRATRLRGAQRQNGQQTYPTTTRLQQNLLPANGCLEVWSRSGAVPRWRSQRSHPKKETPHCLLFSHVLP